MSKSNHRSNKSTTTLASSVDRVADAAIAQLDALESKLDLDIVIRPNDKQQIRAVQRVSPAAFGIAADIVAAEPQRFPDFDLASLRHASAYTLAMERVLGRARELVLHVEKSMQNRRYPAAQQTLALYATVKGLGRIVENETMREKAEALAAEVARRRSKLTVVQQAERAIVQAEARIAKAKQVLEAHVPSPPAATSEPPKEATQVGGPPAVAAAQ